MRQRLSRWTCLEWPASAAPISENASPWELIDHRGQTIQSVRSAQSLLPRVQQFAPQPLACSRLNKIRRQVQSQLAVWIVEVSQRLNAMLYIEHMPVKQGKLHERCN